MAVSLAKRVSASLVCLLLTIPLAALARERGSLAGATVSTRRNGLVATQRQYWPNPQAVHPLIGGRGYSQARGRAWTGALSPFYSPYYSQNLGWPNAYNGYWTYPYYASQCRYSPSFPYLYFYDLYAQEAERSRQAAEEFEASLAREGKLTGPAKPGSYASDSLPLRPRDVALTLDDQPLTMPMSGGPVVIGSGRHTLRIAAQTLPAGQ
jgi:hypothetical protein